MRSEGGKNIIRFRIPKSVNSRSPTIANMMSISKRRHRGVSGQNKQANADAIRKGNANGPTDSRIYARNAIEKLSSA